jgi:hypothetical protein
LLPQILESVLCNSLIFEPKNFSMRLRLEILRAEPLKSDTLFIYRNSEEFFSIPGRRIEKN